ncbi:MAG: hypothetical protein JWL96_3474 [Sphingomonas bacterium]|nr:hypothetical protein [Sphingomonas bacterium]
MAGEILVDLAGQFFTDCDVIMFAQLAEGPRRRDDDQRFE